MHTDWTNLSNTGEGRRWVTTAGGGFRGHFSTKSRHYSTTLSCLRQARQEWRNHRVVAAVGYPDDTQVRRHRLEDRSSENNDGDTILVIGQWQYRGRGHSPGQSIFARIIASDLAEDRRIWREVRSQLEVAA
jgi:hypothetical protein